MMQIAYVLVDLNQRSLRRHNIVQVNIKRKTTIIQISSFIMFRNTYLELYKTSAAHQESLPILISHFSQIYNTLGCVLQDLQFQVGKMLAHQNNSQSHNKLEKHPNNAKKNNKEVDKDIIKIEDSLCGHFNAQPDDQKHTIKPKVNIPINPGPPQSKKRFTANNWEVMAQSGGKEGQVMEKVRNQGRQNIGADSFDSLFNPRDSNVKSPMEIEPYSGFSSAKISPMVPQPKEQQEPPADNTYEDFLDRIFREQDSRKSK